jgi:two-component system chemotaxis sensor kinase CheA
MDPLAAIRVTFFQECEEQLAELEAGLLAMENGEADAEQINTVFRAVHSIKGGAGAFKLDQLVSFAHAFETVLDHVRSNRLAASPAVVKVMLRANDALSDLVNAARDGGTVDEAANRTLIAELGALYQEEETGATKDAFADLGFTPVAASGLFDAPAVEPVVSRRTFVISFRPQPRLYRNANESGLLLRALGQLGEITVRCNDADLPALDQIDADGAYLAWEVTLSTDKGEEAIREVFEFVDGDCDLDIREQGGVVDAVPGLGLGLAVPDAPVALQIPMETAPVLSLAVDPAPPVEEHATAAPAADGAKADAKTGAAGNRTTIRVDLDRIDRLVNLAGELVINHSMLAECVAQAGLGGTTAVAGGLDELEHLTRDIQEAVMAIRAQPVKSVFQRMPRLVREVAAQTGKSVKLVMEGEGTEVDTTVIEKLSDPLVHMIRNAIDHGLEAPERRVELNKPKDGVVRLAAMHRSSRIVIEVSDDGAGIDRQRVKAIAAKKGLISADATLSDEEIDNLIFLPGFSTQAQVSNISGRGVGMDVVRRSIQSLGGRVSIASWPGKGSAFTMSLPLTLAVLEGMVVSAAEQTVVVPMTTIIETLRPKKEDVHGFAGGGQVLAIRGEFVPVVDVGEELRFRNSRLDPTTGVALLVESDGGVRSALVVDAVQGQRQVVIKSLEANFGHIHGVAAATILGNGRVALILDVDALVSGARDRSERNQEQWEDHGRAQQQQHQQ